MKLRAQILRMLNKYRSDFEQSDNEVCDDISFLKQTNNPEFVAKILFKEIASQESEKYINICSLFALEVLDKKVFEDYAVNFLQNKEIPDTKKFLMISLIKQKGIYFDYENIEKYVENPQDVAQDSVKKFLENVISDPETQIDLIDFYINIPKNERLYLLDNIVQESMTDSVAYSLSILVQLENSDDELEIIKETMLDSDSAYSIEGIEYILNHIKINIKERRKFKNKLKKLQEKYLDFYNNALVKNSKIYDSTISFIDGNSNFSLILSRISDNNLLDALLLTINTNTGITACMGFGKISASSYSTIKRRLFADSIPVEISPVVLKSLFKHYKNKNKLKNEPLPYELIVWEKFLSDIEEINYDISEFLNSKLDSTNLTKIKVKTFLKAKPLESWYWAQGQNKYFDELIKQIEQKHITNCDKLSELVKDYTENKLLKDDEFLTEIKDRLLLLAYVSHLIKLKITSSCAYSLCFKNPYINILVENMLYKSLYEYFIDTYQENIKQNSNTVFKRDKKSCYNNDEIEEILSEIEEKWL